MSEAFAETTVLTDVLLKKDGSEKAARAVFRGFEAVSLPHFAWKEFKRGPLRAFVWIHNKLADTRSFQKSLSALQKLSGTPQKYLTSTTIQAIHTAFVKGFDQTTLQDLQARYGKAAELDQLHADMLRLELKKVIYGSWPRRKSLFGGFCDALSCYRDAELSGSDGRIEIAPRDCPHNTDCCLKSRLARRSKDLGTLRKSLPRDSRKETEERYRVLKQIEKHQSRIMTPKDCRAFGDAYFVLFCPKGATIVTTNLRDIQPMADALGVKVISP